MVSSSVHLRSTLLVQRIVTALDLMISLVHRRVLMGRRIWICTCARVAGPPGPRYFIARVFIEKGFGHKISEFIQLRPDSGSLCTPNSI
jgi:hypothetical protein